ncbi:family 20 glycosylhydrolase [Solitalea sp. MAHUQ-68]|uniref:beta-N-acetylhexosaminidase n=1 Tax=Solitalea agri TaxID=2953739 RepID=A0A9X2JDY0_9SPHI|nr:family 20 glycosylhydrolase [Solitalea agri]MCO4294144.1 family 20 glycosylhydrolase [Solitalea agri]
MFKKLLLIVLMGMICAVSKAQDSLINIIPKPVSAKTFPGNFLLTPNVLLVYNNDSSKSVATFFKETVATSTGNQHILIHENQFLGKEKSIRFYISGLPDSTIGNEGYRLQIHTNCIELTANTAAGLFYGMQSLVQLFPPEIMAVKAKPNQNLSIPCAEIIDYPRFGWRGMSLDVCRHFFSKEYIKKYLDNMARYKYNVFHWHLTDDQGWRIEIKSFPRLTSVGAWRAPRMGEWWTQSPQDDNEASTYGGFYTKEDVKEIVDYAAACNISVLPEIDVPGHALAALAAYPELSCFGGNFKPNVGDKFYKKIENSLCVGNECSFELMDSVLTEVAAMFPGKYIHIGGDECYKGFWEKCPKCKARMKTDSISTLEGLQSYFIHRMEQLIISKGKRMIGWDEILEGGLAPEATVMSWRGLKGGVDAANLGHNVIMTPDKYCYLDLYQGDPDVEYKTYSVNRLSASYSLNPVPEGIDKKFILGGQANVWTENIPNTRHLEYMVWPRAFALSEVFWSPQESRNWNDFVHRMEIHFKRFDNAEINYSRSSFDPVIKVNKNNQGNYLISVNTEVEGLTIYYSFEGPDPDNFYPLYSQPLEIPKGADTFKAITYRNGKPIGRVVSLKMKDLEKRMRQSN